MYSVDFVAPVYKNNNVYLSSILFYSKEMKQREICCQVFNALIHHTNVPRDAKMIVICFYREEIKINVIYRFELSDFNLLETIKLFTFDEKPRVFRGTDEKSPISYYGKILTIDPSKIRGIVDSLPGNVEVFKAITLKENLHH